MTLNQIKKRIRLIALAHNMVRDYREGLVTDFFADRTAKYPAILIQDNGGGISLGGHASSLIYRLYFIDLVHVSSDAKTNIDDVLSDMLEIAKDILATMASPMFNDWKIGSDNALQLFDESENDLHAGCYIDITISTMYKQNTCQIPMEAFPSFPTDTDMKVYDLQYQATAAEGSSLTIPALAGKKIILITRENNIIYRASNLPGTTEYAFDGATIILGTPVAENGERFLILWRNY